MTSVLVIVQAVAVIVCVVATIRPVKSLVDGRRRGRRPAITKRSLYMAWANVIAPVAGIVFIVPEMLGIRHRLLLALTLAGLALLLGYVALISLFIRRVIPWDQFSDISADGGLAFELKDGTEVGTISYGGSLIGAVTNYRGLKRTRAQMLAACDRYRSGSSDVEQVHRHEKRPLSQVKVVWWPLLAYLVPLEAIAITADLVKHTL